MDFELQILKKPELTHTNLLKSTFTACYYASGISFRVHFCIQQTEVVVRVGFSQEELPPLKANSMRLKAAERLCLLLQQFRSQIDLGSINGMRMELFSHVAAIEEAE